MIKLTDEISSILIDENSIIAIVPTSNHLGSRKTCVHLSGGSKLVVNETPEVIISILNDTTSEKVIDWEQRRYEIARNVLSYAAETSRSILMSGHSLGDDAKGKTFAEVCASSAISFADALINELKKGQDNEN